MILDEQALFSDSQALTVSAASTNVIKMVGEIAKGTQIELFAELVEAIEGATAITIKVQTSADEAFTNPVDLVSEKLQALEVGTTANLKFMPKGNLGYVRLYYDITGTATAGKITAGVCDGQPEGYHN